MILHSPHDSPDVRPDTGDTHCCLCLPHEAATIAVGQALAPLLAPGLILWLDGDLGAGKTTLVRALLRALGHAGPVKSPTYTLVEVYAVSSLYLYHFDFYRFNDPEEFVDAGLGEYFRTDAVCLVEWPAKARGYVPAADVELVFRFPDAPADGRILELHARSEAGRQCLNSFRSCSGVASLFARSVLPFSSP
ncbi:tRNA (adenosine(37)-N6)-threonylcarbamoyltransferase complex ATPase subunit type 1 TsaE [uncultured Propionivibrio sp.]|uniref:tRNA (adenosine(37)-N6)-threonylcarbamoyltransferase complex ATPase subunit type 1 TsaE n=1 Tax=uncultured Propionivibrio sp. TaxID=426737 RepID=UPI003749A9C9